MQTQSFFTKRIGKRIYRDNCTCTCRTCNKVTKEGLIINDELHARYLYDLQCDYAAEGILLNYRDVL